MMKKSGGVYTDHSFPGRALDGPLVVATAAMHH